MPYILSINLRYLQIAASIGLAVKVLWDPEVKLDGDGGFSVRQCGQHYIFKPISVQALWTIIQTLHMLAERLTPQRHSFIEKQYRNNLGTFEDRNLVEETEDWVKEYEKRISSGQSCLNEWHEMPDLLVKRPRSPDCVDSSGFQSSNRKGKLSPLYYKGLHGLVRDLLSRKLLMDFLNPH